ncbi:hypothetical protein A7Q10_02030 [Methylacidiphilum caldifontis]|uniref:SAM-dependent methyltransferase n=2 Tax=Methylacidiphilum caldifontis TaxID=2795386 RepID=A0A4Y8P7V5_9BACT|nr:hypothetical protein A7Q10_02030 [Methylacidiphilum caldifontis]
MQAVPFCPVCGANGRTEIKGARDPLGSIPGSWSYKRCESCFSLWMDPRPIKEDIPKLYPKDYYTHEKMEQNAWITRRKGLISQIWKKVWVSELSRLGYQKKLYSFGLKPSIFGQILALFPPIKMAAQAECRFLAAPIKGKVLDVGCGNGSFLFFMKQLGWVVQGIEQDSEAAQNSRQLGISITEAFVEECSLEKDFYEAITLSHVIEHLADPKAILLKLYSSLKPGGTLVSISPNPVVKWAMIFCPNWRGLEPTKTPSFN